MFIPKNFFVVIQSIDSRPECGILKFRRKITNFSLIPSLFSVFFHYCPYIPALFHCRAVAKEDSHFT